MTLGFAIYRTLGTAIGVADDLRKLIDKYRRVPECYNFAAEQCIGIRGQLAMLQNLMLNDTWSERVDRGQIHFDYFVGSIMSCAERVTEFEHCLVEISRRVLQDGNSPTEAVRLTRGQRFKYLWMEDDVERLGGQLRTCREHIAPMLQILQRFVAMTASLGHCLVLTQTK